MNSKRDDNETLSRTKLKQEAQALQKVGEELVKLSRKQLESINLPEKLFEAVEMAKTIKSREALRRQMQYIGRVMNEAETESIEASLNLIKEGLAKANESFHQLENLRDELIEKGDSLIGDLKNRFPEIDQQHIRQLIRNAKKEILAEKPIKSSRQLFRYLRELAEKNKSDKE